MSNFEKNEKQTIVNASQIAMEHNADQEDGIDLLEYFNVVRRRWLLVLFCLIASVGASAFVTFRMTKIYRATTTIRIETQAPQVLGRNVEDVVEMGTGSFWSNVEYYETQYKIIESRKIALIVVDRFHLHENIDFMQIAKNKMPASREDAALKLKTLLTVQPIQDSRLVDIHIDYHDPAKAQLYANAISNAYVSQNLNTMHKRTIEAVDWLGERLDKANTELKDAEVELLSFKKENNILSISLEDRQSHITAQMQTAAQNLIEAKSLRIKLQSRKKAISKVINSNDPMAIPINSLNDSHLIQELKQSYTRLSQEYGEMSAKYGNNFPKMVEIKAKMDRIQSDIKREVNNVILAINAELNESRLTEAGLGKALKDLELQAHGLANNKGGYNDLARTVENNESVYSLLKGRSEEAKLTRFLKVNNVEVLDLALIPVVPIKPRVFLNLVLAAFFGVLFGVALSLFLELSDRTIKNQDDIDTLGVPFLGIVPSIDTAGSGSYVYYGKKRKKKKMEEPTLPQEGSTVQYDNYVFDNPKSQVAESLRSIRTNLMFMSADKRIESLLVTSPSPQEGKTTVAANLAIIMARSGSSVLLVDTDMRRPRVHKAFDIKRPSKGLSTMILGETTTEEAIIKSRIPNLDILVCGPTPPDPSELIHTDAFKRVINMLREMYDIVIFDSPPIGIVTDSAILSTMVDGTMLVVKSLKTTKDSAKHAVSILKDIDSPILGAVLNGLDLSNKKYGRYYYHYYNRYGSYYGEDSDNAESSPKKES